MLEPGRVDLLFSLEQLWMLETGEKAIFAYLRSLWLTTPCGEIALYYCVKEGVGHASRYGTLG